MEKYYVKDAMPRLYSETKQWLKDQYPELLGQLPHLRITGRCRCGECSDFYVDSDYLSEEINDISNANGNPHLDYPIKVAMDNGMDICFSMGPLNNGNLCTFLAGWDLDSFGDYQDGYINLQLERIGFKQTKL